MIIAVCGNSGSGKSTLAVKLATALAARQLNTVLIDTDFVSPQFNVWYPKKEMFAHQSLSVLLDNNIDIEATADKIHVINDTLGVLGYARDFSVNAIPRRHDTVPQLLSCLEEMSDVIVVDVQTGFINDNLSFEVMNRADVRLVAISPDVKALSWYDSNIRMMEEQWQNNDAVTIKAFNKTKASAPLDDIQRIIGEVSYYIPYCNEVEEQLYTGTMADLSMHSKTGRQYLGVLRSLTDEIVELLNNGPKAE